MSIPTYQEFMNPVLEVLGSKKQEMRIQELEPIVANMLGLSDEERNLMTKTGVGVVSSRVYWATYYMYAAGLLAKPRRGYYEITPTGMSVLKSGSVVNDAFLMQYPEFASFIERSTGSSAKKEKAAVDACVEVRDPDERIDSAINEMNVIIEEEILASLKSIDPKRFEQVVVDLMVAMDYGVGNVTRYAGDGGVDGIIDEDELGLSKIYLQAKRYNGNKVAEREMRDFVGAMVTNGVSKGVFMTTSDFAPKAVTAAKNAHGHTIRMVNGQEMAKLMRLHNLGVRPKKNYDIKEFDASYFE